MATDNQALSRQWFELVWNRKRAEVIDEMMSPSCVVHGLGEDRIGPAAFREFHDMFLGAFPDITVTVDDVIGEADKTAGRFTVRGTHRGDHLGFKATGKPLKATGMFYAHWKDGRMVEAWNEFDSAGRVGALRL
jgi:predicted ester cyclase